MFDIVPSAIAALLFLVLAAYLMLKDTTLSNVVFCIIALALTAIEVADILTLHVSQEPFEFKKIALFFESLLPITFLVFSFTYSRQHPGQMVRPFWMSLIVAALIFPVIALLFPLGDFFYSPDVQTERILFVGEMGYWFYMGIMVYCAIALVNIEATFASSYGSDRWKMKFEVIGVSALLAVLIFYFSQGLLYRTLNMNLIPVRSGVFIMAILLVGYSKLLRGNNVKVAVSRHIVYRSLVLLMLGVYLLSIGLIGEGMRYFNIPFGRDLFVFAAFASGITMLLVLLSEQLRRKIKVFISKHFYANKHDYREEWLKFSESLASCGTIAEVHDAIIATYKKAFGLKGASLYLLDKNRKTYSLASNQGMYAGVKELHPSKELISYFVRQGRVLNPLDGEYELTEEESSFVGKTGAWLVVPLLEDDNVSGLVVLGEQLTKENIIYEDYDLMKTLAKQAALSLINFSLSEELAATREEAAVARISSFVIHDLKNLTYSLSLLLENAEDNIEDPEFQEDMIVAVRNSVTKMRRLAQRLRAFPEKQKLDTEPADIGLLVRKTMEEVKGVKPGVELLYDEYSLVCTVDAEEFRKVILNLILNALEATGEKGRVRVTTGRNNGVAFIRVEDNGCGISEEFSRNHLFKPFRTTKDKGLGIGLYQCKQIVEAHGGRIEVSSEIGKGSHFTVHLSAEKTLALQ